MTPEDRATQEATGQAKAIDDAVQVILDALSALQPPQARELMASSAYKAFAAYVRDAKEARL